MTVRLKSNLEVWDTIERFGAGINKVKTEFKTKIVCCNTASFNQDVN